jgi:putative PIN family toxin of toxin-antitoxin system
MPEIVLDTNVVVAGLRAGGGRSREVMRRAIDGRDVPLFGTTLWLEYEAVLTRPDLNTKTTRAEREAVLAALAAAGRWVSITYRWRPNLPDAGDDHLVELAMAGAASFIVTWNVRDLGGGELAFPTLKLRTPKAYLEEVA